ncbi:hypothetical protein Patl1_03784 [Pistacia atlantica]|uniref:Uncharacterized protein n=1 Tax=Pistacia atlantica TaxID=434234 RepID=A0ACC1BQD8_9ROSI|nr:hypothetical protein Patl1_03784 [Pistacia atlantica]
MPKAVMNRLFYPNIFSFITLVLLTNSLLLSTCFSLDEQGQALLTSKNSLSTPTDALKNWNFADSSPCKWFRIYCNSKGEVVNISLKGVELEGSLPSNFQSLKTLKNLTISSCNLTGIIPKEIGEYYELTFIDLSDNSLSGLGRMVKEMADSSACSLCCVFGGEPLCIMMIVRGIKGDSWTVEFCWDLSFTRSFDCKGTFLFASCFVAALACPKATVVLAKVEVLMEVWTVDDLVESYSMSQVDGGLGGRGFDGGRGMCHGYFRLWLSEGSFWRSLALILADDDGGGGGPPAGGGGGGVCRDCGGPPAAAGGSGGGGGGGGGVLGGGGLDVIKSLCVEDWYKE